VFETSCREEWKDDADYMSPRRLGAIDVSLSLDYSRPMTLTRQLEQQLRQAIKCGRLAPGTRLPSTRALSADLSVSRGVVARAYAQLAAENYLEVRERADVLVCGDRRRADTAGARSLARRARWDLRPHLPELSVFPRRQWLRSLERALVGGSNADFGYVDPLGHGELRLELADYLGRSRGVVAVEPEQIVITTGSTQSLNLLSALLARAGRGAVGFENPSHEHFHTLVERRGLRSVGVPVDRDGIVVSSLDSKPDAVVVSPLQQFPTGVPLSAGRRTALTAWATASGALIIEDDYEAGLINDRSPPCLQHSAPERIAYIGSANKVLAPSFRIGWCVLPPSLIADATDELATGLATAGTIQQLAFADFLRRGELDRHLRKVRKLYRTRRELFADELQRQLPEDSLLVPAGGLHVVLELESAATEAAAQRAAAELGVRVETVSQHALPAYDGSRGLVVGFGAVVEAAVPTVVTALRQAVAKARHQSCADRFDSSGFAA
jgi:GntR family transcriptional regulator / MocR family aminotransferase